MSMLEKLLELLKQGGTFETSRLAEALDTSPEMVEAMLEHLQEMGLVQPYEDCPDGCAGCSLQGICGAKGTGARVWQVPP